MSYLAAQKLFLVDIATILLKSAPTTTVSAALSTMINHHCVQGEHRRGSQETIVFHHYHAGAGFTTNPEAKAYDETQLYRDRDMDEDCKQFLSLLDYPTDTMDATTLLNLINAVRQLNDQFNGEFMCILTVLTAKSTARLHINDVVKSMSYNH